MKKRIFKKNFIKKGFINKNKKSNFKSSASKKNKKRQPKRFKSDSTKNFAITEDNLDFEVLEEQENNPYLQFVDIFAKNVSDEEFQEDDTSDVESNDDVSDDDEIISDDEDNQSSGEDFEKELTDDTVSNGDPKADSDENIMNVDICGDTDENYDEEEEYDDKLNFPSDQDSFTKHLEKNLIDTIANKLLKPGKYHHEIKIEDDFGICKIMWREELDPIQIDIKRSLHELHIRKKILDQLSLTNLKFSNIQNGTLNGLQLNLLNIINSYKDICFLNRNLENCENIRIIYTLHAVNHILKTRSKVIMHNTKIKTKHDDIPDEYRDQGFTRPKVLMVLPFRDSVYKVINIISSLLEAEKGLLSNKQRFLNEYYQEDDASKKGHKPEDFENTFDGNIDDHFRIGIGIAKKSIKLYTDFYSSDIILASPLGLRTIIGSEDDNEREFDFLSSIELLIMDQVDVFFMQNWEHVLDFMKHLHLQPSSSHGVNFARIRMSYINGWSSLYRQTMLFSQINSPEINSIFNKYCHNYEGKLIISKPLETGIIGNIVIHLPQVFRKFEVEIYSEVFDKRFDFFITKILPELKSRTSNTRTLIFISSYFDFVRLRNYFTREDINYTPLCEYAKEKEISKARQKFFHKKVEFMLYTERFHFFHRYRIRGVDHIVFYDLPIYPHFYHELCNNMGERFKASLSNLCCTVLFNKYDVHRLNAITGIERTNQMITSHKDSFMFLSS